jgi:hypothetical protein
LTLDLGRVTNRDMSRSRTWLVVSYRAIVAAILALFLALGGANATSRIETFGFSEGPGLSEASLCVLDDDAAPVRSHCRDHCRQILRDVSGSLVPIVAGVSFSFDGLFSGRPAPGRRPHERPPGRVSGWESSWSSRAPPMFR